MILTDFYLCNIFNAGLLLVTEYFLQCGISTFTEVKNLNTSSIAAHQNDSTVQLVVTNVYLYFALLSHFGCL